jgi:hypothetical protein
MSSPQKQAVAGDNSGKSGSSPPLKSGTTPPSKDGDKRLKNVRSPTPPKQRTDRSLSRPRTRGRQPREIVVERVIRESGGSNKWPQLTKTNYDTWSLLMKLKMEARDLWDALDTGDVDFHDDRTALDAICSAVPEEMVPTLATKPSAKDAWEAIKTMRIGDDRMRKSTA